MLLTEELPCASIVPVSRNPIVLAVDRSGSFCCPPGSSCIRSLRLVGCRNSIAERSMREAVTAPCDSLAVTTTSCSSAAMTMESMRASSPLFCPGFCDWAGSHPAANSANAANMLSLISLCIRLTSIVYGAKLVCDAGDFNRKK